MDALDEYLRTLDPECFERSDPAELARIFPSLAASAGDAPATVLDERYRVHRAVRALLEQLAETAPLVLLLDDLHWADPASADLVAGLLRRPPAGPGADRARAAPDAGGRPAGGGARAAPPERAPDADRARAAARSRRSRAPGRGAPGRPGPGPVRGERRESLLPRAARPDGRAGPRPAPLASGETAIAESEGVPPAIAAALAEELASLSPKGRSLLEAGSVIGDPFELELAAAAGAVTEAEALPALDELLASGLLRRTDVPRRFRFRHPLLRRAVYGATGSGWRSAAHERAARALAAHGERAAVRARHVEQFAALGDRDAIAVLREAADASAQRAPESAVRWYRAALRLLPPGDADDAERIEVVRRLAAVLTGTGQFAESRAVLVELLELMPPEATAQRIEVVTACAGVEHLLGEHDQAHAALVGALDELPERSSVEAASLLLELAYDAFYRRDYPRMLERGNQARALAEQLDDRPLGAAGAAVIAMALTFGDHVEEAQALREEAAAIVDALGDEELAARIDAAASLGNAETYLGHLEDAVRHLERGLAVARASGQGKLFPPSPSGRRSPWRCSADSPRPGRRRARRRGGPAVRQPGSRGLGAPQPGLDGLARRGPGHRAPRRGGERRAGAGVRRQPRADLVGLRLRIVPSRGRRAGALSRDPPSRGGRPRPSRRPGVLRALFQERVALAWLAAGDAGEAELAAGRAEARAAELGLDFGTALAKRARAAVALAAGDVDEAVAAALESAGAAERSARAWRRRGTDAGRPGAARGGRSRPGRRRARARGRGARRLRRRSRPRGGRARAPPARAPLLPQARRPGATARGSRSLTARQLEVAEPRAASERRTGRSPPSSSSRRRRSRPTSATSSESSASVPGLGRPRGGGGRDPGRSHR